MQNFVELDMEKLLDPKAVIFEVWGLKTSLGPKVFSKGLTKP